MRISDWSSDVCSADLLGYQAESGAWRNYYLAGAASLRGNAVEAATSNGQSRSFVSAIPTAVFFDALATRFDAAKGSEVSGTFQFVLPDSKESVDRKSTRLNSSH